MVDDNVKNIELVWHEPCKFKDLEDFFKNNEGLGGLYLWIFRGKSKRIRYIGEAKIFRKRFQEHLKNVVHGLYSAIKCEESEDLREKYRAIKEAGKEADQTGIGLCYHPKDVKFDEKNLKDIVEDIKNGIELNLKNFIHCRFLFAEIKDKDAGTPADEHLRKKVESIFMAKTKKAYLGNEDEKCWCNFRKNTAFWGTVSEYHEEKCLYKFHNLGVKTDDVLTDIGIEGKTWEYLES